MIRNLRQDITVLRAFAYELVQENKNAKGKILSDLNQIKPIYAKLIKKSVEVFPKEAAASLASSTSTEEKIRLKDIKEPIFSILKRIHALKPYQKSYIEGLQKLTEMLGQNPEKTVKLESFLEKAQTSWTTTMTKTYNHLVLLAQRIELKRARPGTPAFEKMIGFERVAKAS